MTPDVDRAAMDAIEGRSRPAPFVPREKHERTIFTNAQRPSNRGVNAGGKPWQDGPPQGHRPRANADAAFGAELAGHEGHSPKGEDDPCRKRATASPTPSDGWPDLPAFLDRRPT